MLLEVSKVFSAGGSRHKGKDAFSSEKTVEILPLICSIIWPFLGGPGVISEPALEGRSCPGQGSASSCDVPTMLGTKLLAGHYCMGSSFLVLYPVQHDGTASQCDASVDGGTPLHQC